MGEAARVGRPAPVDWPPAKPGPDLLLPAIACSSAIPIASRQCGPESLAERFPARPADGQGRIWRPAGPRQWREDAATASAMPPSVAQWVPGALPDGHIVYAASAERWRVARAPPEYQPRQPQLERRWQ